MTDLGPKLNPAADRIYRTALRDAISRLLNDLDFPGKKAQAGRAWLEGERTTLALEQMKERTLEVLQEARGDKARRQERQAA